MSPNIVQVAIKKVLQDKRFKNRELQIMKMMNHPNVVSLKHCFYSTTEKEEVRSTSPSKYCSMPYASIMFSLAQLQVTPVKNVGSWKRYQIPHT